MTPGFGQNGTMGGAGLNSQNTWNPGGGGMNYSPPPSPNYGSNAQGNFSQDFGLNQGGGASGGGFPGSSYNPMMRSNGASTMAAMQQQLGRQQQLQSNPYSQQLAMLAPYGATEIKMNPDGTPNWDYYTKGGPGSFFESLNADQRNRWTQQHMGQMLGTLNNGGGPLTTLGGTQADFDQRRQESQRVRTAAFGANFMGNPANLGPELMASPWGQQWGNANPQALMGEYERLMREIGVSNKPEDQMQLSAIQALYQRYVDRARAGENIQLPQPSQDFWSLPAGAGSPGRIPNV